MASVLVRDELEKAAKELDDLAQELPGKALFYLSATAAAADPFKKGRKLFLANFHNF